MGCLGNASIGSIIFCIGSGALLMNVFTYGSLTFDRIWSLVVRGSYRSQPARVGGFARFAVTGQDYPGVLRQPGGQVDGRLYFDVEPADLARLDHFEGADYERVATEAALVQADAAVPVQAPAQIYLFRFPDRLSAAPWDINGFAREGIHRFVADYCARRVDPG